jgi:hypothetical protein
VRAADWFSTHRPPTDATPRLSITNGTDGALSALGIAIKQCDRDGSGRENLHTLVLEYCAQARREGIAPEQMLVRLKHTLDGSLSLIAESPASQEEARATIITMAIDAYYDDRS